MKIVIEITEHDKSVVDGLANGEVLPDTTESNVVKAIQNGTPLPKEHGDLKDIETFKLTYGNDGAYYRFKDIVDAPTIIEADKGGGRRKIYEERT